MRVVYVDVLFMSNLAVNYLLLVLTARVSGVYTSRLRLLCGGALGAVFAVFLFFPELPPAAALAARMLLCAAIVLVAFNREPLRVVRRVCLIFLALSFALAGGMVALIALLGPGGLEARNGVPYFDLSLRMLLGATLGIYGLLGLIFGHGGMAVKRKTVEITLENAGRSVKLRGFTDTGNLLRDPIGGKRIIIIAPSLAVRLFPEAEPALLDAEADPAQLFTQLGTAAPGRFRLMPCKTAGGSGLMVAGKIDRIILDGKPCHGYLVGIAAHELETAGGCRAIIGA